MYIYFYFGSSGGIITPFGFVIIGNVEPTVFYVGLDVLKSVAVVGDFGEGGLSGIVDNFEDEVLRNFQITEFRKGAFFGGDFLVLFA
jgi:hypothetical protein